MKYENEMTTLMNQDDDLKSFLDAVVANRDKVRIKAWVSDDERKFTMQIECAIEEAVTK